MNILSSPIWPSDMPDERRVIALLGLVQISEEGMSNNVSLLADLRSGKNCSQEAAAAISQLEQEVDRLNALVAMMQFQKYELSGIAADVEAGNGFDSVCKNTLERVIKALSATAETVSAWQSKRDTEIRAKALEGAADWFHKCGPNGASAKDDVRSAKALLEMASELRAKGE